MKDYEARKQKLIELLDGLQHRLINFRYDQRLEDVKQLKATIEEDQILVVTVGEFNNGKSTFVNALLNEKLLPMGITPTTATINMLVHGEERELFVHKQDGSVEQLPLQLDHLEAYIAEGKQISDEIRYLKMTLPSAILHNKVVLVDTPGVNDLNTTRSFITYGLMPRADIVLFMLNMTTPVRRTEFEFLTETVLKQGLDRILFIANYADVVDESVDEVIQTIRSRLAAVEELKDTVVLPLSAVEALEGKQKQDMELIQLSGIQQVEQKIQEMVATGSRGEEKLAGYGYRYSHLLTDIAADIERHLLLSKQTEEELEAGMQKLIVWHEGMPALEEQVEAYTSDRFMEIKLMLDKSIEYLFENVQREVEESISIYHGSDIGQYFQTHIPLLIKRRLKTWIEHYADRIDDLLVKLEAEISKGLSESFEQSIEVKRVRSASLEYDEQAHMQAPELDDPMVKSGLLVGGAGALAMVFGAPIFIPIIAMAGLPYVQKKMLKHQLDTVKPKLKLEVINNMRVIREDFSDWVESYVNRSIRGIQREAYEQIKQKSQAYANVLAREKEMKKQGIHAQQDLQNDLQQFLLEINEQRQLFV